MLSKVASAIEHMNENSNAKTTYNRSKKASLLTDTLAMTLRDSGDKGDGSMTGVVIWKNRNSGQGNRLLGEGRALPVTTAKGVGRSPHSGAIGETLGACLMGPLAWTKAPSGVGADARRS